MEKLDSAKAQALYEQGETYAKEGNYNKAIKDFEAVLKIDPNNTGAKELLEKSRDKLIESLSAAINIEPSYFALCERGSVYYKKGDYDKAIEDFTAVLKIKPDDYFALGERGSTYYKKGIYDKAIEDFEAAYKTAPFCSQMFHSHFSIRLSLEKSRIKFIESLSAVIKIKPNDIIALVNRGNQYANIRNFDKAIKDYNVALKINPNNQYIIFNRGLVYAHKGKYGKAIKDFKAVLKIDPNGGLVNAYKGNYGEAINDFKAVSEIDPNDKDAKKYLEIICPAFQPCPCWVTTVFQRVSVVLIRIIKNTTCLVNPFNRG